MKYLLRCIPVVMHVIFLCSRKILQCHQLLIYVLHRHGLHLFKCGLHNSIKQIFLIFEEKIQCTGSNSCFFTYTSQGSPLITLFQKFRSGTFKQTLLGFMFIIHDLSPKTYPTNGYRPTITGIAPSPNGNAPSLTLGGKSIVPFQYAFSTHGHNLSAAFRQHHSNMYLRCMGASS